MDLGPAPPEERGVPVRGALFGSGQAGGDGTGLLPVDVPGFFPEIALCRRLHAEQGRTGLRNVQVYLHDPPFPPDRFDEDGPVGLGRFPDPGMGAEREDVLRDLLGDGAAAADPFPVLLVVGPHLLQLFPVESVVLCEAVVLRGDDSLDEVGGYFLEGNPFPLDPGFLVLEGPFQHEWCVTDGNPPEGRHQEDTGDDRPEGNSHEKEIGEFLSHAGFVQQSSGRKGDFNA